MIAEYKVGDKLCSCTLLQYCGDGGYGEVWLAEDAIGTRVALKILRGKYSEKEVAGLKHYKDCNHPNLLKIRHVEISENLICYTMDAADDLNRGNGDYQPDTLAKRLEKNGSLDGKEISAMLDGLLAGLEELHSHGLVHRDIKPDNILWVNGRPTLSDAGLVAPIGKHTLVGTPGFVSPRLLETDGIAQPSDDFYALSKVVYCALTGLAPREYPTIPQEMTISLDPRINRAVLAGCRQNIKSSAEFRKAIAEKVVPQPQRKQETRIVTVERVKTPIKLKLLLLVMGTVLATVVFWVVRTEYRSHIGTKEPQELLSIPPVEMPIIPNWEQDFLSDRTERLQVYLQRFDLLNGAHIEELLNHQLFNGNSIEPQVSKLITLNIGKKAFSQLSLFRFHLSWQMPDADQVKERQDFWKSQDGEIADIAYRMLTEDPTMQMVAVNWLLEHFCRQVMEKEEFDGELKEDVENLIDLQQDFTNPQFGTVKYMSREAQKKYDK